jgi:hypothetical protein
MRKALKIFVLSVPILIMIGLIPLIQKDYLLTSIYIVIIVLALRFIRYTKRDVLILVFGFVIMIISEYIFVSTGVEKFTRHSLFGIMPVWLPFLWAYGFVAIKRSVEILDKN